MVRQMGLRVDSQQRLTLFVAAPGAIPRLELSPIALPWEAEFIAVLLRWRFLFSLLELAGRAKFPTGGIFASLRPCP